jgi:hypothetical protein
MKMLNLIFNAFGITLTAAAVYGAMDGQIFVPIGFAVAAVAVALLANFVEARGIWKQTAKAKPAADDRLRMWPVSRRVNKTGTGDDPTLLDEVAVRCPR